MKLAKTIKYLSKTPQIKVLSLLFCFLFFISPNQLKAQEYSIIANNQPLSEALLASAEMYNFKVAFDSRKLNTILINKNISGKSKDELVTDLLKNTGFTYIYKHGSYLIIEDTNHEESIPVQCNLSGTISDRESGEELPFATIMLPSQNIFLTTSTNGNFSIGEIISNPVKLCISYLGYQPVDTIIYWTNPTLICNFKLNRKSTLIDSVGITGNRLEMVDLRSDAEFSTIINPAKLIDLPVLAEIDIFKTLQLLPGINYSEKSAELNIRGGSGDQNLILFDGQTIYNLSHYYGVFSSINPTIVKDIQVFKGGYDSRYGERISGVVDIIGKSGNKSKPTIYGGINMLSADITAEIPVGKKITLIAAGRRSYSDIYATSLAKNLFQDSSLVEKNHAEDILTITEPKFKFYDYNSKITYKVSEEENISLSLYGGKDFYENSYNVESKDRYISSYDSNTWMNYGLSAIWQKQINKKLFTSVQTGASGFETNTINESEIIQKQNYPPDDIFLPDTNNLFLSSNNNKLKDFSVSSKNTYQINNFNQLNFGILLRRNNIYYYKDADNIYIYDNIDQSSFLTSFYLQDRILLKENLIIKPGIRLNYYNNTGKIYFEPRFATRYNFSKDFSLRMAIGHYNQYISQVLSQQETGYIKNFWVLANDSINPVIKSNHLIIGTTYEIKNFIIDIEAYYKTFSGIQEYIFISPYLKNSDFDNYDFYRKDQIPPNNILPSGTNRPSYFINGRGLAYGIDFFMRYKTNYYTSWISYSLSRCLHYFDSINFGKEIPAPSDQLHQLSWTNMISFGKWNFSTITLFSTGSPYVVSYENRNNMLLTREYGRLPNYFRTDISANYNFTIKKLWLKTGISIINVFNSQNYYNINSRKFDFNNKSFYETNLTQSQKLSLNIFLHFLF